LIRLLVTFVGIPNLNSPTDMCKSRKKIKADPSADSSKAFTVNREVSIVDVRGLFFRADAGCLMCIAHLWS